MKNIILNYLIKKYSIITFDIFDTLVERKVDRPSDVFVIVGEKILGKESAEIFVKDRIEAENIARRKLCNVEVSLGDIYKILEKKYEKHIESLINEEIQTEIDICIPKSMGISAFNYAIAQKKEVYIISDMYLPQNVIEKILSKCEITGEKEVFVSNECGVNKISGKLFQYVVDKYKLDTSEILHIGDSIKADCFGAMKMGIRPYLIGRKNRIGRMLRI